MRVAVVGGGIAGLAAAWELRHDAEVTVFEPNRLGGCIRTSDFAGSPVDEGPDAFLTRVPEAVDLCRELALEEELVAPAAGRSAIWWNGRLRTLPEGLVLGVPSRLGSILGSGILGPAGVGRAAMDLVLPRRPASDPTVRQLVAARFGAQVADRLVDPLVGSIHAGWTGDLSAAETVPQLAAAAARSRSLLLGLRQIPTGGATGPIFLTPAGGLSRMVEMLTGSLAEAGVAFVTDTIDRVEAAGSGRVAIDPVGEPFDGVVVATPAREAARLLGPEIAGSLASIPTASVALIAATLPNLTLPPGLNGFLVPRTARRLMTACSFASNKWPHWSQDGAALVRISVGRYGDHAALDLDDGLLAASVTTELGEALGADATPGQWRVSRWPDSFAQYLPGHGALVAGVESTLAVRLPGVALAGASYRGAGIPACIASGRRAARERAARRSCAGLTGFDGERDRMGLDDIWTVVLCGGKGTRAYPHTVEVPKPLLEVAGRPILEHVLDIYARQGAKRFLLAAGYKIDSIRRFARELPREWEVLVLDTGEESNTGTRILRCRDHLDDRFMATYGDGVGNVDLSALLSFHEASEGAATLTTVPLPSQYGTVDTDPDGRVLEFKEKPRLLDHWINGGFFVMEPRVFDNWSGEDLEKEVLPALAHSGQLHAYRHHGFWKSMDTYKDAVDLTGMAGTSIPPWFAEPSPSSGPAVLRS